MPKLCIDCKHYHANVAKMADYCTHPDFAKPADLVRGENTLSYCDALREKSGKCGIEAVNFAPKVPQ